MIIVGVIFFKVSEWQLVLKTGFHLQQTRRPRHKKKTKQLCDWAVILPTNRFVLTQNWSLSWSKLALSKPGFKANFTEVATTSCCYELSDYLQYEFIAWLWSGASTWVKTSLYTFTGNFEKIAKVRFPPTKFARRWRKVLPQKFNILLPSELFNQHLLG